MARRRWTAPRAITPFAAARQAGRRPGVPRLSFGLALWLLALLALLPATSMGAQSDQHHAGVVVRYPDGQLTYAYVTFAEEEISGIELLRRTKLPLVTVGFGGLGEGVCSLSGKGCPAAECRKRVCQGPRPDDPFWQYFRLDPPRGWTPFLRGASAATVVDGDVDGWSWTGGEPNLPATSLDEIARLVGAGPNRSGDADEPVLVRTIVPEGIVPSSPAPRQGWQIYAGALTLLTLSGAGTLLGLRRQRTLRQAWR